jgi:hypothetical protein
MLGVLVAIAITTAMDAGGLSMFSALALLPLMVFFWYWERLSPTEIGFRWGGIRHYGLALLHSLLVLGLAALIAWITGAIHIENTVWHKAWLKVALMAISTILGVIITEEGFFRGWLWGSLKRTGLNKYWILAWTSVAFAAWHLSAVLLETGFNPPLAQVPVFLVNAVLLGAIWGMLRLISGSVVVSSVAHGVWNGFAYVFFGFGSNVGALGIQDPALYGPEVGFGGVVLNLAFAVALWQWCKREDAKAIASPNSSSALVDRSTLA